MTLIDFLEARLAEDEAFADAASPGGWQYANVASVGGGSLYDEGRMIGSLHYEQPGDHDGSIVRHLLSAEADANGLHVARHDPARVLADVNAKRHALDEALVWGEGCQSVIARYLAEPYADHPDYDEEWRP